VNIICANTALFSGTIRYLTNGGRAARRLYDDNWEREGFVEIAAGAMQPGDIIMMSVQASVTNHAAVYVGDNIILHHLFGHLSSRTPYGKYYRDRTVRVVRHKDRMHG
jgi:cell wall-associated NlpC family hydrolase